jgi:hypothetical protein
MLHEGDTVQSASEASDPIIRHSANETFRYTESRGLLDHAATSSRPVEPDAASPPASAQDGLGGGGKISALLPSQQHHVSRWYTVRSHLDKRVGARSGCSCQQQSVCEYVNRASTSIRQEYMASGFHSGGRAAKHCWHTISHGGALARLLQHPEPAAFHAVQGYVQSGDVSGLHACFLRQTGSTCGVWTQPAMFSWIAGMVLASCH